MNPLVRKLLTLAALLFGLYVSIRYLLPLFFPFFLGGVLALAAEPAVGWMHRHLGMRRSIAAGIGVTGVFVLAATVLTLLLSLLFRQLSRLTQLLPAVTNAIRQGTQLLEQWLLSLADFRVVLLWAV